MNANFSFVKTDGTAVFLDRYQPLMTEPYVSEIEVLSGCLMHYMRYFSATEFGDPDEMSRSVYLFVSFQLR